MISFKKKITITFFLFFLLFTQNSFSEDQNVLEILEIIQKDLKTLEKAVYSDSDSVISSSTIEFDQNAEDVLTRHLLNYLKLKVNLKN